MRTKYITRRGQGYTETVDEFPYNTKEERREAHRCLNEYRICDPSGEYYLSQRPCQNWYDEV